MELDAVMAAVHGEGDWLGASAPMLAHDLPLDADLAEALAGLGAADGAADVLGGASRLPRLRPVLVALAARAAGASAVDRELQLVAELLHGALALHDATLGSPGARRRQVARRVLRGGADLLGGHQVLLRALSLARHVPHAEILDELLETVRAFADADELAAELRAGALPTVPLWQEHADGHTAALFSFCCRAGATIAGASPGEVAALGRYGRHLGRMWHAAEDIVILQGPEPEVRLAKRAVIGRPMLPVAVALERDPELASQWRALMAQPTPDRARGVLSRMHAVRAVAGTRALVAAASWDARRALQRAAPTPYRHALERLARGLARGPYAVAEPGEGAAAHPDAARPDASRHGAPPADAC